MHCLAIAYKLLSCMSEKERNKCCCEKSCAIAKREPDLNMRQEPVRKERGGQKEMR